MSFAAENATLLVLLAVPLAAWAILHGIRARHRTARRSFPHLAPVVDLRRRGLKGAALGLAVLLLAVAVLQPLWGSSREPLTRRGRDLVVMLDVSLSMLAADTRPSRFAAAMTGIEGLIAHLERDGGHRVGLIAFAGRATLQAPPTLDYAFLRDRLKETEPDMVVRKGTAIGDALRQVADGFVTLTPDYTDLMMITDGEDHDSLPMEAAEMLSDMGVDLYMVGLGDPVDGAAVPESTAPDAATLTHQGVPVISVLDEPLLRQLARAGGGAYLAARTGPVDLVGFYRAHLAGKPRREIETAAEDRPVHRYRWFAVVAFILLTGDLLLSDRADRAGRRRSREAEL